MAYSLPLRERRRFARNKREQYRRDPDYRLACINKERARQGRPLATSLAEVQLRLERRT